MGLAVVMLAAAGCGPRDAAAPSPAPAAKTGPASATGPAPPSAPPPFFAGRWAAREELCADQPWIITASELRTPAGVTCGLGAPEGAGPTEVDASCTAEGPPRSWRLRFAYAQSARALLIENGPFADIGLVRCPG
jgi:hypothetical protein